MAEKILMPALSPTMTEGTLARWLKAEGDSVVAGDVLAEIETDKATMEVEAVDEGVLAKIVVAAGTEAVAVNSLIAVLQEDGDDETAVQSLLASDFVAPANSDPGSELSVSSELSASSGVAVVTEKARGSARLFASPLARRLAASEGLDLADLSGSGPKGRIVQRDIEAALAEGGAVHEVPAKRQETRGSGVAVPVGICAREMADKMGLSYRLEPLSAMRKIIASRLCQSKQTVPHFYLSVDCEIDALLRVRKELNASLSESKISVNDFVVKAVAHALTKVPDANAAYSPQGLVYYDHADVSVAVATPTGLITPIVKCAESKGLAVISSEIKDMAARARDGKLQPEEYQGGTFSCV